MHLHFFSSVVAGARAIISLYHCEKPDRFSVSDCIRLSFPCRDIFILPITSGPHEFIFQAQMQDEAAYLCLRRGSSCHNFSKPFNRQEVQSVNACDVVYCRSKCVFRSHCQVNCPYLGKVVSIVTTNPKLCR